MTGLPDGSGPVIPAGEQADRAKFSDLNMLVMLGAGERTTNDFERLYRRESRVRLTGARPGSPVNFIEAFERNPLTQITMTTNQVAGGTRLARRSRGRGGRGSAGHSWLRTMVARHFESQAACSSTTPG